GLGHAAGDAAGIDEPFGTEELEGADHAADGAEQAEEWGRGHDGLQDPQPASERLLDEAGLFRGPGLDPPGRLRPMLEDDLEEAAEVVAAVHPGQPPFELLPREAVRLDDAQHAGG